MSRTYRNRHTVPPNAVVRDDGELYYTCCPNKIARHASWVAHYPDRCPCNQWRRFRGIRRSPYRTERKAERKEHYRSYRAKVKDRMRHEEWENIPRFRRTGGWLTW
jgi:hypothetical protein